MQRVPRFQARPAGAGVPLERPRPRAQEHEVQHVGPSLGHPGGYVVRDTLLQVADRRPLEGAANRQVGRHSRCGKRLDLFRRLDHPRLVHQTPAVDQRGARQPFLQPVHERGCERVSLHAEPAPGKALFGHRVGQQVDRGGDELLVGAHVLDPAVVPVGGVLALAQHDCRVSLSRPQQQHQPVRDQALRDYPGARKVRYVLQRAGDHAV